MATEQSIDTSNLLQEWLAPTRPILDFYIDSVILYDTEDRIVFANNAFTSTFGWQLEEVAGKPLDFAPAGEGFTLEQLLADNTKDSSIKLFISQRFSKDGQLVHVQANPILLATPEDGVYGYVVTLRNISEQVATEQALRASEETLQQLLKMQQILHEVSLELVQTESLNQLYQLAITLGRDRLNFERIGLFLYDETNGRFTGTFGIDPEGQLRDETDGWMELPPEQFILVSQQQHRVVVEEDTELWDNNQVVGRGWHIMVPLYQKQQLFGLLVAENLLSQRPLLPYEPDLLASLGAVINNLIEQKRAEANLRQNELLLQTVVNSTSDWIFIKDSNFRYQLVNKPFADFMNIPPTYFIGKTDIDIGLPEEMVKGDPEKGIRGFWDDDREVMETGQVKVIEEEAPLANNQLAYLNTRRVPLRNSQNEIWGVLGFSQNVTEQKKAEQALEKALIRSEKLYEMSVKLSSATTSQELVEALVIPLAGEALRSITVLTIDVDDNGRPEWGQIAAIWVNPNMGEQPSSPVGIGSRFNVGNLPMASKWIDGDMAVYGDVENDDEIDEQVRHIYKYGGTKAAANLPLRLGNKWIGFLTLSWSESQTFTDEEKRLFKTLTGQTAVVLNNQLLLEQTQKRANELATVAEVGTAITTIREVDELLQQVVDLTKERFNLYHAHVYLLDESDNLVLTSGSGEVGRQMVTEGRIIPLQQTKSLIARAARRRAGVIVNDVTTDPDFLPHHLLPNTKSEMAVPIIVSNKVLGVLDVQSDKANHFTQDDVRTKVTLGAQIGVALQNARSFARSETALNELEELTRRLRREGWEDYFSALSGEMGFSYNQKELVPIEAAPSDIKSQEAAPSNGLMRLEKSLLVQGESIGTIALSDPQTLKDDAGDIITAVAERLSAHIENLRLSAQTEQARRQAERLYQGVATLNSSQSYADVLQALRQNTILGHAYAHSSSINYFDRPWGQEPPSWVEVIASWGSISETLLPRYTPIQAFQGFENLLRPDSLTIISDMANDDRVSDTSKQFFMEYLQAKAMLFVPMTTGAQWIGYITAVYHAPVSFSDEETRHLSVLSQQAAVAIQSLYLFAQAQARAERERRVRTISDQIRRGTSRQAMLDIAKQQLAELLGASKTTASLNIYNQPFRLDQAAELSENGREAEGQEVKG